MKLNGKLDYLELPATGGTLDSVKAFYSANYFHQKDHAKTAAAL